MTESIKLQIDPNKQTNLSKSKSSANPINFSQKLTEAIGTNNKLKELLKSIQTNAVYKKLQSKQQGQKSCGQHQIGRLKKKQGKLMSEIQQLTNNLNVLVNENYKLKLQVDSSRNSRVIYSNVYKTLEKEIRKNEYLYKMAIIEGMTYREIQAKINEKVQKAAKKIEKQINQLQGVQVLKKKQKQKSRLDTGLSTNRGNKVNSKETNRQSSRDDFSNRLCQTRRDDVIQESVAEKKQSVQKRQQKGMTTIKQKQQAQKNTGANMKTSKSIKTRNKINIPSESNQYFNLQIKSNYYDNTIMYLSKICGQTELNEIAECWKNIDIQIQNQYKKYEEVEQKLKTIEKEMGQSDNQSKITTKQDIGTKSSEQRDLEEMQQQIKIQQQRMSQLQAELSKKMDFNCSKLTNQEISHHILRMKNQNLVSQRELQKLLQSISKQKTSLMCSRLSQSTK